MTKTHKEQREQILETIVEDDLDGVVVEDDDTVLAKWDREDKTVKIVGTDSSYKILPDEDRVWDFELVSDAVRKRHPELRPEDLEERYEDNPLINVRGSNPEIRGNLINFRETNGHIKLRTDYDPSSVIEVYRLLSNRSIRLDVEHGYVQYIQVYNHENVPFEAVVDELRSKYMSVERNRTDYNLGDL
jgi:hypothetical protein